MAERHPDGAEMETIEASVDRREFARGMGNIRHKIMVMSGKGGVGKSFVSVNLAMALALAGRKTGLLDIDIHGPSIPIMLGLKGGRPRYSGNFMSPLDYEGLIKAMSIGFMLPDNDDAIIMRGPSKIALIQQLLRDVRWGNLDYLIIDAPPGTGDEPLTIRQLLPDLDGAIIVTTSQEVALEDARKSADFCRKTDLDIIGIVENMSDYSCPRCGEKSPLFGGRGAAAMARDIRVPFLGGIPFDPAIVASADVGRPFVYDYASSDAAIAFSRILPPVLKLKDKKSAPDSTGYADPTGGQNND